MGGGTGVVLTRVEKRTSVDTEGLSLLQFKTHGWSAQTLEGQTLGRGQEPLKQEECRTLCGQLEKGQDSFFPCGLYFTQSSVVTLGEANIVTSCHSEWGAKLHPSPNSEPAMHNQD